MPSINLKTQTDGATVIAVPNLTGSSHVQIKILGYQITSAGNPGRVTLKSGSTVLVGVSSFSSNGGGLSAPPVDSKSEPYAIADKDTAITVGITTGGVDVDINVQYAFQSC